jgi:hypothetical protein
MFGSSDLDHYPRNVSHRTLCTTAATATIQSSNVDVLAVDSVTLHGLVSKHCFVLHLMSTVISAPGSAIGYEVA